MASHVKPEPGDPKPVSTPGRQVVPPPSPPPPAPDSTPTPVPEPTPTPTPGG